MLTTIADNEMIEPTGAAVLDTLDVADLAAALAMPRPPLLALPEDDSTQSAPRQAAVLIPFVRQNDRWEILFIRRAHSPRDRHSGEVAFPGGMWESSDPSLEATALREAWEEIGLPPRRVRVLATLPSHFCIASIEITPVVAVADWPCKLRLQRSEVARAFTIPLRWLATPEHFSFVEIPGSRGRSITYQLFDGERLWGATARMMLSLLTQLLDYCGQPLPLATDNETTDDEFR